MFYVYTYADPETNEVFYVGKGHGDRDRFHYLNRNSHYNKGLGERIRNIVDSNMTPIITRVGEFLREQDAYDLERVLIAQYGRLDLSTGTLYNRTPGGEGYGRSGSSWSDELRQEKRRNYAANPRGATYSKFSLLGEPIELNLHREHLREMGFTPSMLNAINACANGKRFSAYGYRWCRSGEELPNVVGKGLQIEQLLDNTVISTYPSIQSASRDTGINASDINQCVLGQYRSAGGFFWRRVGSTELMRAKQTKKAP